MPRLDAPESRRRLEAARHGYLATADGDGVPHVVPVTFAVVGDADGAEIVTAVDHKPKTTPDLRRLRNLAANPRAAVLVDAYDDDWDRLWWVRADGSATVEVPGDGQVTEQVATALQALVARYPQYRDRPPAGPMVRLRVLRWSGWAASRAGGQGIPSDINLR